MEPIRIRCSVSPEAALAAGSTEAGDVSVLASELGAELDRLAPIVSEFVGSRASVLAIVPQRGETSHVHAVVRALDAIVASRAERDANQAAALAAVHAEASAAAAAKRALEATLPTRNAEAMAAALARMSELVSYGWRADSSLTPEQRAACAPVDRDVLARAARRFFVTARYGHGPDRWRIDDSLVSLYELDDPRARELCEDYDAAVAQRKAAKRAEKAYDRATRSIVLAESGLTAAEAAELVCERTVQRAVTEWCARHEKALSPIPCEGEHELDARELRAIGTPDGASMTALAELGAAAARLEAMLAVHAHDVGHVALWPVDMSAVSHELPADAARLVRRCLVQVAGEVFPALEVDMAGYRVMVRAIAPLALLDTEEADEADEE